MEIAAGTRLGPYEIGSQIGAGGMGEVYRARDTRLDRAVAIKVLPAEFAHDAQLRARFEREAKTISQLNHPNICTLHDVGNEDGTEYLVMELLEGSSLADRLSKGPLPISEVLRHGAEIADALDRAHRAGVVHRDLKPANVIITRSGAKLLDFGLAKQNEAVVSLDGATEHKPLTREGTILGTFQYMSPEQLEGSAIDARSDIFALGALLYEMATGRRAFEGASKTSLIAAIVSQDPKPLRDIQPLTPPAFEHVVAKCLSKNPEQRWQSAHDIAEELRWIGESGSHGAVGGVAGLRRRQRTMRALGVMLVVAVAAIAAWAYARRSGAQTRTLMADLTAPPGLRFNAVGDFSGASVVSPDGNYVVFSATDDKSAPLLWMRNLITGQMKSIAGTDGAIFPFWSPDSRKLGFFAAALLKVVDVRGGVPVTVAPTALPRGGAWGAGDWIVYAPRSQGPLVRVRASGGPAVEITKLDATKHTSHRWPAFLPDGKHFLYLASSHQDPLGGGNGVYLSSVEGEAPRLVMPSVSNGIYEDGHLLFTREQTLFAQRMTTSGELKGDPLPIAENVFYDGGIWRSAVSVSHDGLLLFHTGHGMAASKLRWLDRNGKEIGQLADSGAYWDVQLSPDGQKVVVPTGDPLRELWLYDLRRNTHTRVPLDQSWTGAAAFSPDSGTLYISILRNGVNQIISRRVNGGDEHALFSGNQQLSVTSVSPDGRTILVQSAIARIGPLTLTTASQQRIVSEGRTAYSDFSPDGRWIAYQSDQNGKWEVFIKSAADPNLKWQISNGGGTYPRWRGDGRELFYVDASSRMVAVPIETSSNDLTSGTPEALFTFTPRPQCRPFAVTADGQRFLVNSVANQEPMSVVIVSNWKSRLEQQAQ